MMDFQGYRRPDGKAGTRNYVLVIPSVGCSQGVAQKITQGLKGAVYLPNIFGCGQVGEDRTLVKKTLVGFGKNPNVFAVLIVGHGCEQLSPDEILKEIAPSGKRVEVIVVQEVGGTKKTSVLGRKIVKEMLQEAAKLGREPVPWSELILGTECGGSDFTSGLASNPAVGAACDMLVAEGGTVILSETPELIGAEHLIAKRARTPEIAKQVLDAVAWWEKKAMAGGQNIREANPSPGNIAGGITTLEEKSLGCIYKAGTSPLEEVMTYASHPTKKGLVYMDTPAHDIEQLTGMVAGGAQIVVFTTGKGNPLGTPIAPVIKITGNRDTYHKMRDNMDIDVSEVLRGKETVTEAGKRIFEEVISVASGKVTKAEKLGQRDFCIFKVNVNI
jgi:altronate dehydratase large subunit